MLIVCALASSCGLFKYSDKDDEVALSTPIKVEYKMYQVIKGDIKREFTGMCTITSFGAVKYAFRVGGYPLQEMCVRSGQEVKRGTVLAIMNVDAAVQSSEEIQRQLDAGGLNGFREAALKAEKEYYDNIIKNKELKSEVPGTVRYINTKFTIGRDQNVEVTPGEIMVVVDPEDLSDSQGLMVVEAGEASKYTMGINSVVTVTTNASAGKSKQSFDATVIGSSSTVSWDTDTITYFLDLSNAPADSIKVGDRLSVKYEEPNQAVGVLKIPISAVYSFEGRSFVYVLDAQGLRRECYVEVGVSDGSFIEIKSGLELGQQIVQY